MRKRRLHPLASKDQSIYPSFRSIAELGQQLRAHRRAYGWTLEETSTAAGMNARAYADVERDREGTADAPIC